MTSNQSTQKQQRVRASTDEEVKAGAKQNGKPDQEAQQAQIAEAEEQPRTLDFDGYTYELLDGQPSPKALTYIARWQVDDENMALLMALREMLGEGQWDTWCTRHSSDKIMDFWVQLNRLAGGGQGN